MWHNMRLDLLERVGEMRGNMNVQVKMYSDPKFKVRGVEQGVRRERVNDAIIK